jgi:hypothetical protein
VRVALDLSILGCLDCFFARFSLIGMVVGLLLLFDQRRWACLGCLHGMDFEIEFLRSRCRLSCQYSA